MLAILFSLRTINFSLGPMCRNINHRDVYVMGGKEIGANVCESCDSISFALITSRAR